MAMMQAMFYNLTDTAALRLEFVEDTNREHLLAEHWLMGRTDLLKTYTADDIERFSIAYGALCEARSTEELYQAAWDFVEADCLADYHDWLVRLHDDVVEADRCDSREVWREWQPLYPSFIM